LDLVLAAGIVMEENSMQGVLARIKHL